jgi:glycosyltransferase involved in cell wall biosynthesis
LKPKGISCLIPFYNEDQRILDVLAAITQVKSLDQIVCVDDGSTDHAGQLISQKYPQITLLQLQQNLGKAGAIARGIKSIKGKYILLFDADLTHVNPAELQHLFTTNLLARFDMLIFGQKQKLLDAQILRSDVILSGERIIQRTDLEQILKERPKRYQLEVAINHYMIKNKKTFCCYRLNYGHVTKSQKIGLWRGVIKEILMIADILKYVGPITYFTWMLTFCRGYINHD